jgi:hypothetical protein
LTAKNAIQASKGKDAHLGREVSRFAERYTITQRFLWNNLQRMLDPEAEESFAKQAAVPEKWGSQYWWAPGEVLPGEGGVYGDELGLPKRSRTLEELGLSKGRER